MPSVWFPTPGPRRGTPFAPGVQEGPFPRFHTTIRLSDSLPLVSPHFVAFVSAIHPCARFAPTGRDARPGARGVGVPVPEPEMSDRWKRQGLSGSRATLVSLHLFLDPGRTEMRQAIAALRRGPRLGQQRWLPPSKDFGARSHGIGTRCLRFAVEVTLPPRKTRFRLLAKLCRAGFVHPQGCDERFPSSSLFLPSRAYLTL